MRKGEAAKEEVFVQAYLAGCTGAESVRQAGYTGDATREAYRLLRKASVQQRLNRVVAERVNMPNIMQALADMAFADIGQFLSVEEGKLCLKSLDGMTRAQRAQIQSVKQTTHGVEVKLYDRQKALAELVRLLEG